MILVAITTIQHIDHFLEALADKRVHDKASFQAAIAARERKQDSTLLTWPCAQRTVERPQSSPPSRLYGFASLQPRASKAVGSTYGHEPSCGSTPFDETAVQEDQLVWKRDINVFYLRYVPLKLNTNSAASVHHVPPEVVEFRAPDSPTSPSRGTN